MGLTKDIENAFLKSMGNPEDKGNVPELAQDLSKSIIDFLTKQTFTVTELKALLEVEDIKTSIVLQADVLPTVTYASPAGVPTPLMGGTKGVKIPKLNLSKRGGQGGILRSTGHAYIGRNPVSNETNEENTKVKLLKENIVAE